MNPNDIVDRMLAQARELQKNVAAAASSAAENAKPMLEESLKNAHDLQATLATHAQETGAVAGEQSQKAMGHLAEFMKMGTEAMQASAEHAREIAGKMMEQGRATVESATASMGKNAADAAPHHDESGHSH